MSVGKYKYIDNTGEDAFGLKFDDASWYDSFGYAGVRNQGRSFYINTEGAWVLETNLGLTMFDKYGLGLVQKKEGRLFKYGMLTVKGELFLPLEHDSLSYQSEGLFCAEINRETFCLDGFGRRAFGFGKYRLRDSPEFRDGRLLVGDHDKTYFMDTTGQIVHGPYWSAQMYCDGLAYVKPTENGDAFFVNVDGENVMSPCKFDSVSEYWDNDRLQVQQRGKYGLITKAGTYAVEPIYDRLELLFGGQYKAFRAGACSIIDKDGRVLIEISPEISDVRYGEEGILAYEQAGKWGYLRIRDGLKITGPIFSEAGPMRRSLAPVRE